jgi:murein tripeptide amidase MpaA
MLKITNNPNVNSKTKPSIFIIGRQHSGETYSSFIIHGLINFLISKDPIADALREAIEFYIIPAVNPDGIVLSNYRCNL